MHLTTTVCGSNSIKSASVNPVDGTYTISVDHYSPLGYYIWIESADQKYVSEWWTSSGGNYKCNSLIVRPIHLTEDEHLSGIDFHIHKLSPISGSVFRADGTTLILEENLTVTVETGKCSYSTSSWLSDIAEVDSTNGTYTFSNLNPGDYYLRISDPEKLYITEHWAFPESVSACKDAMPIHVIEGEVAENKDFQVNKLATLAGTLFHGDGTSPVTGATASVTIYSSPHCNSKRKVKTVNVHFEDGSYIINGIKAGTYVLHAEVADTNLTSEWWAKDLSSPQCLPQSVFTVADGEVVIGKNFQLNIGSTISGTVFVEDGTTPLSSSGARVNTYSGNACDSMQYFSTVVVSETDGTYTVDKLPPGSYYLKAREYESNYVTEWWDDAASSPDCSQSSAITVNSSENIINKNFQLDVGAVISGTVFEGDGVTPISYQGSSNVFLHRGDPCREYPIITTTPYIIRESPFAMVSIDKTDGSYSINKLPAGTYYLSTDTYRENYVDEWWASPDSRLQCSYAEPLTVAQAEVVQGKNFQLDTGAVIEGTIFNGDSNSPITGKSILITAYSGDPCVNSNAVSYGSLNRDTGVFRVPQLPAGSYFLHAEPKTGNFINEWWSAETSKPECDTAQTVAVTTGETVSNINFQLNTGSTLSGTVYKDDGSTPILDTVVYVKAFSGSPCGDQTLIRSGPIDTSTGQYSLEGLMPGTYFLRADDNRHSNGLSLGSRYNGMTYAGGTYFYDDYVNEWWTSTSSNSDCADAEPLSVAVQDNVSGINFQLNKVVKQPGDVTLDGRISLEDAVVSMQLLAGKVNHTVWIYGDSDYDGTIGIQDVLFILEQLGLN